MYLYYVHYIILVLIFYFISSNEIKWVLVTIITLLLSSKNYEKVPCTKI